MVVESMEEEKNQIVINIVMFLPVGLLSALLWRWREMLFSVGVSCVIELLQLFTARGLCEFDDVFHDFLGALIGIGTIMLFRGVFGLRI